MLDFYNTINARDPELSEYKEKARTQKDIVLAFFRRNAGSQFTPAEVHSAVFHNDLTPITSTRRAITNLTDDGLLAKSRRQREGKYGKPNYCWYYPDEPRQLGLF